MEKKNTAAFVGHYASDQKEKYLRTWKVLEGALKSNTITLFYLRSDSDYQAWCTLKTVELSKAMKKNLRFYYCVTNTRHKSEIQKSAHQLLRKMALEPNEGGKPCVQILNLIKPDNVLNAISDFFISPYGLLTPLREDSSTNS